MNKQGGKRWYIFTPITHFTSPIMSFRTTARRRKLYEHLQYREGRFVIFLFTRHSFSDGGPLVEMTEGDNAGIF